MENIQSLLKQLQNDPTVDADNLDHLKQQLTKNELSESDFISGLHTLKTEQKISEAVYNKVFDLIQRANAETQVSSNDQTRIATETSTEKNPSSIETDKTRIQTEVDANATVVKTDINITSDATVVQTEVDPNATVVQTALDTSPPDSDATHMAAHLTTKDENATLVSGDQTYREQTKPTGDYAPSGHSKKLKPGGVIKDRFILKNVLGSGGMSIVFRALDLRKQEAKNQNPYVAIKVLGDTFRNHPLSLLALERETQKIQSLAHPNIITVYDFDRDGENIYMTMECLEGQSLDEVIRNNKEGMPFAEAQPIIEDMCNALIYAHSKDIIHSDFKPENVYHTKSSVTKVLDFGIARANKMSDKKKADTVFDAGSLSALTPPYASLEMLQNKDPDPRDDIYALGCVTYKLLTGTHPYKDLQADLAQKAEMHPTRINNLDRRQWQTLVAALAFKREDRITSVEEFLDGIEPKKKPLWAYALAIGVVISIGVSGYVGTSISEQNAAPKVVLTPDQEAKILNYLEIADLYYSLGYLATPPGDSALDQYEKILEIDPTNKPAIEGKKKLVDRYQKLAAMKLELGEYEESLQLLETGLLIEPENEELITAQESVKKKKANLN